MGNTSRTTQLYLIYTMSEGISTVEVKMAPEVKAAPAAPTVNNNVKYFAVTFVMMIVLGAISFATLGLVADIQSDLDETKTEIVALSKQSTLVGTNPCHGKKPYHSNAAGDDNYFKNQACMVDGIIAVLEQAGGNVTKGFKGDIDATTRQPITKAYWQEGLCPVNVHWHNGAEHLSVGEYDTKGHGPASADAGHRKLLAAGAREGFLCHHYDAKVEMFTKEYAWKHCKDMHVGQTYEVHWPHSAAGACGTPNQYQTPFYDGVFCNDGIISLDPLNTFQKIGVQGQVFTIVNDERYYYPDLIRGMIVDGDFGKDIGAYTGSTTGTTRNNQICSKYTPITWQVDRKCHMISASSFDKMCADMKAQRDDMSDDLHAHGSRELVKKEFTANNLQDFVGKK